MAYELPQLLPSQEVKKKKGEGVKWLRATDVCDNKKIETMRDKRKAKEQKNDEVET